MNEDDEPMYKLYDDEEDDGSCCSNPNIKSATYVDWCENCGWTQTY